MGSCGVLFAQTPTPFYPTILRYSYIGTVELMAVWQCYLVA